MEELIRVIDEDIKMCDDVLKDGNISEMKNIYRTMFNKYLNYVKFNGWGWNNRSDKDNLISLKGSLEVYKGKLKYDFDMEKQKGLNLSLNNTANIKDSANITNNNSNNITNTVDLEVMFDNARNIIEEDEALGEEEIKEIMNKIKEIEEIGKEDIPKSSKWRKVKGCMGWVGTKGVKVATTVIPLIMKIIEEQSK
ncbi:hypothetical protein AVM15_14000 [Paraclostridium benzoelyticum]|nr:hypothetical protein AVM15_14000 [Paraclostridium benzoelyticum]